MQCVFCDEPWTKQHGANQLQGAVPRCDGCISNHIAECPDGCATCNPVNNVAKARGKAGAAADAVITLLSDLITTKSSTGYRGVQPNWGRYQAECNTAPCSHNNLGTFDTPEDAAQAYLQHQRQSHCGYWASAGGRGRTNVLWVPVCRKN